MATKLTIMITAAGDSCLSAGMLILGSVDDAFSTPLRLAAEEHGINRRELSDGIAPPFQTLKTMEGP